MKTHRLNTWHKGVCGFTACLVALWFLPGCARLLTTDKVPEGSPKGYVEFYELGWPLMGHRIYSIQKDRGILEGRMLPITRFSKKSWRRVAKIPGDYVFRIEIGTRHEQVIVKILSDMVTLVRIETKIIETKTTYFPTMITTYYTWTATVGERRIPLKLDLNALEPLLSALDDPDWGTRWHAAEALGQMGKVAGEMAVKRLTELLKDDPNEHVREAAKDAQEKIR